ncbi:MAG TPA: FHA domain-containing protein [Nannocystis sp.]
MALRLIIEDEEGATTIVPLGDEEITIGREPGNTIQLTEQNVSRQHARLTPGPDGWVIEDLDSYNGVRVNGVLIEGSVTLNEGDVVQIGDYHLAITNNAEQITINGDRAGAAAATDSMRAAPNLDLPRIPATEAALIAPPPQQPIRELTPSDIEEGRAGEEAGGGKSKGLLFALLAVVVIGGSLLAYQFAGGGEPPPAPKTVKNEAPAKVEEPPRPEPKVEPKPPDPPPHELPNDPVPTEIDEPAADEGGSEPPPETTKKPTKGEKVVKPTTPKTEKPQQPKGDPVQLLEEARKANLAGNATQAYDLAKKSYEIDKSPNALALMGASACKMGDQAKAKAVFKKLTDPNRQKQMISVCADRGIMLE